MNDPRDKDPTEDADILKTALSDDSFLSATPSTDFVAHLRRRLMETAALHRPPKTTRRRLWLGWLGVLAIAASVCAVMWGWNSTPGWAAAIQAARKMPWIHIRLKREGRQVGEAWVSPRRDLFAQRLGNTLLFHDYAHRDFLRYDTSQRVAVRASELAQLLRDDDTGSVSRVADLFRGSDPIESLVPGSSVESWSSRTATLGGAPLDVYRVLIHQVGPAGGSIALEFKVDTKTALPKSLTFLEAGSPTLTEEFDYPLTGPDNKRSLGIPDNAPVMDVDQKPQIADAIRALDEGRRDFDNYEALRVTSRYEKARPLAICDVKRILRRANSWRIDDVTVLDSRLVLAVDPESGLVAWREHRHQLRYRPLAICDGKTLRLYESPTDRAHKRPITRPQGHFQTLPATDDRIDGAQLSLLMPECACRPFLRLGSDRVLELIKPVDHTEQEFLQIGMRSTKSTPPEDVNLATLLLDASKGYVARRIVLHSKEMLEGSKTAVVRPGADSLTLRDFRQSPRGFWYPHTLVKEPADKSRPRTTRFYLDFLETPSPSVFDANTPDQ